MADNVTLNTGTGGDIIATEDTGGAEYQKIKIVDGTATSTTPLLVAAEDAGHTTGDTGIVGMAVRSDTLAALAGTTNDYTPMQVDADGALWVKEKDSVVDANNTTTSTLLANTDYTGTGTDVLGYSGITISVFADQDSDPNGLRIEWSTDNTNWDISQTFDYSASTGRQFQLPIQAQFFRVAFQNGGTGQTAFRLETILHRHPVCITTIHRADADIAVDRSATLTKAILMAQLAGSGDFTPIDATAGGNLKVSMEEGTQTPADADATPTDAIHSQSFNMVYNGATWDFLREGGVAGSVLVENRVSVSATGTTTYYNNDLDETEVEVDTGPVNIYSIQAFNTTAAPLFLQMWNTNTVTVGTTTPTNQYVIPGNADSDGAGFSITFAVPKAYSTALSIACTTNNEGNGAPGANACIINIEYAT